MQTESQNILFDFLLDGSTDEQLNLLKSKLTEKANMQLTVEDGLHNLFDLFAAKKFKETQIQEGIGVSRFVWYNKRKNLIELTPEQIVGLGKLFNLSPPYIFQLILNCYPKDDAGEYDFSGYKPNVDKKYKEYKEGS
jgi:hypothetical protein